MIKTCDYPRCAGKSQFLMCWDNENGKHSGMVCATHDKVLGRKNLIEAGMTLQEAKVFERYLAQTVNDTNPTDWPEWFKLQTNSTPTPLKKTHQPSNEQPVTLLNLLPRVQNALRRNNITTIGQLTSISNNELSRMRMLGKAGLREIRERLSELKNE